ncbi:YafY family protein [Nocardioides ginsengisoli]|uniref:Helix-turn-helix transcriptional regulator n=1 Tax=Nocardioides ginsengisoli TaxID=363868 RepID=A0ABW3W275_9ACTN
MSRTPTAAPVGALGQVARLLTLVPFLHHRDGVRLEEAATLLGTTPNQVVQDLRVLFMCGLPGGLPDDLIDVDLDAIVSEEGSPVSEGVIRIENADYLARPLRLTATEASAVIVALRMLRDTRAAGASPELVDRVLAKLEAAAAIGGAPHVEVAPSPRDAEQVVVAQLRALVEEALAGSHQIRLSYFVPSRDEESERVVDPHGIVNHGIFSYLDAWCHRAGADRLFRLDRITKAEILPSRTTAPVRPPRDLDDGLFGDDTGPDSTLVTLRLAPQARWATDYYPMRDVRPADDGSAEVDLVVVDRRWLVRLLLRLAPYAEVLQPGEFTEALTARAQETLRLYQ